MSTSSVQGKVAREHRNIFVWRVPNELKSTRTSIDTKNEVPVDCEALPVSEPSLDVRKDSGSDLKVVNKSSQNNGKDSQVSVDGDIDHTSIFRKYVKNQLTRNLDDLCRFFDEASFPEIVSDIDDFIELLQDAINRITTIRMNFVQDHEVPRHETKHGISWEVDISSSKKKNVSNKNAFPAAFPEISEPVRQSFRLRAEADPFTPLKQRLNMSESLLKNENCAATNKKTVKEVGPLTVSSEVVSDSFEPDSDSLKDLSLVSFAKKQNIIKSKPTVVVIPVKGSLGVSTRQKQSDQKKESVRSFNDSVCEVESEVERASEPIWQEAEAWIEAEAQAEEEAWKSFVSQTSSKQDEAPSTKRSMSPLALLIDNLDKEEEMNLLDGSDDESSDARGETVSPSVSSSWESLDGRISSLISSPSVSFTLQSSKTRVLGKSLHEKLSSPDRVRSRSPTDLRRRQLAKLQAAEYNRDQNVMAKQMKARKVISRVQEHCQREQRRLLEAEQLYEGRLKSAEKRHDEYLKTIRTKAYNENSKVDEIQFLNTLNAEEVAEQVQKKLVDVENRILAATARRQERLEEISSKQRRKSWVKSRHQMSEKQFEWEQQRCKRWESLQQRLEAVQKMKEERLNIIRQREESERIGNDSPEVELTLPELKNGDPDDAHLLVTPVDQSLCLKKPTKKKKPKAKKSKLNMWEASINQYFNDWRDKLKKKLDFHVSNIAVELLKKCMISSFSSLTTRDYLLEKILKYEREQTIIFQKKFIQSPWSQLKQDFANHYEPIQEGFSNIPETFNSIDHFCRFLMSYFNEISLSQVLESIISDSDLCAIPFTETDKDQNLLKWASQCTDSNVSLCNRYLGIFFRLLVDIVNNPASNKLWESSIGVSSDLAMDSQSEIETTGFRLSNVLISPFLPSPSLSTPPLLYSKISCSFDSFFFPGYQGSANSTNNIPFTSSTLKNILVLFFAESKGIFSSKSESLYSIFPSQDSLSSMWNIILDRLECTLQASKNSMKQKKILLDASKSEKSFQGSSPIALSNLWQTALKCLLIAISSSPSDCFILFEDNIAVELLRILDILCNLFLEEWSVMDSKACEEYLSCIGGSKIDVNACVAICRTLLVIHLINSNIFQSIISLLMIFDVVFSADNILCFTNSSPSGRCQVCGSENIEILSVVVPVCQCCCPQSKISNAVSCLRSMFFGLNLPNKLTQIIKFLDSFSLESSIVRNHLLSLLFSKERLDAPSSLPIGFLFSVSQFESGRICDNENPSIIFKNVCIELQNSISDLLVRLMETIRTSNTQGFFKEGKIVSSFSDILQIPRSLEAPNSNKHGLKPREMLSLLRKSNIVGICFDSIHCSLNDFAKFLRLRLENSLVPLEITEKRCESYQSLSDINDVFSQLYSSSISDIHDKLFDSKTMLSTWLQAVGLIPVLPVDENIPSVNDTLFEGSGFNSVNDNEDKSSISQGDSSNVWLHFVFNSLHRLQMALKVLLSMASIDISPLNSQSSHILEAFVFSCGFFMQIYSQLSSEFSKISGSVSGTSLPSSTSHHLSSGHHYLRDSFSTPSKKWNSWSCGYASSSPISISNSFSGHASHFPYAILLSDLEYCVSDFSVLVGMMATKNPTFQSLVFENYSNLVAKFDCRIHFPDIFPWKLSIKNVSTTTTTTTSSSSMDVAQPSSGSLSLLEALNAPNRSLLQDLCRLPSKFFMNER